MAETKTPPIEISAEEAAAQACLDRPLIDIRTARERLLGAPVGAEVRDAAAMAAPGPGGRTEERGGFILCAEGVRSLELARRLRENGRGGYLSVRGGFRAWQEARLPATYPEGFDAKRSQRYARHLVMPQVGPGGQRTLFATRVLLAGLGGLNAPAALYLAAAGVGRLGLVDPDRVERSNLQRQVIHSEGTLGWNKAVSAQARIRDLNPEVETVVIERRIDSGNAAALVSEWDIVIDGTDNFSARYALNDACIQTGKPLVYGAVMRFQGQVSVFWPTRPLAADARLAGPCFRCMHPEAPAPADVPGCAEAGVLGVLPGVVGALQAAEALKLALEVGEPLIGRLLMFDALGMEFRQTRIAADPDCFACGIKSSRS